MAIRTHRKQSGLSNTIILTGVAVVTVVVAVAWFSTRKPAEVADTPPPVVAPPVVVEAPVRATPIPPPPEDITKTYQLQGALPLLGESDEPLKAHLRLLAGALPVSWLNGDQIIQKIVVQIDNIAKGDLAYQHSPLVAPAGGMSVKPTADAEIFVLDTSSYARYNLYSDFLANINPELLVAFYRYYEPLLDQAYIKLGNAPGKFRGVFVQALKNIEKAPVLEGEIRLHRPLLTYDFVNPAIESKSMVDKQLIRMGPTNTRKIQRALQPLLDTLGG